MHVVIPRPCRHERILVLDDNRLSNRHLAAAGVQRELAEIVVVHPEADHVVRQHLARNLRHAPEDLPDVEHAEQFGQKLRRAFQTLKPLALRCRSVGADQDGRPKLTEVDEALQSIGIERGAIANAHPEAHRWRMMRRNRDEAADVHEREDGVERRRRRRPELVRRRLKQSGRFRQEQVRQLRVRRIDARRSPSAASTA